MTCEAQYSKDLYANILPDETGMSTGYAPVGFVELACDADRWHYYRRVAAFNRHCGVDVREISAADVEVLFPACLDSSSSSSSNDVLAGFYVATDGRVNPHEATMALARAARMRGVVIREGVTVERVTTARDPVVSLVPRVTGVEISQSASSAVSLGGSTNTNDSTGVERIRANVVVNCAGMWARQLGEANGVAIPNQAAEHYYLLTDAMPEIDPLSPVIEDSSKGVYVRPEGGGLMLGLFEGKGAAWNAKRIPNDFSFGQIDPDWNRMSPYLEEAMKRVPSALNVGVKSFFCGPESFTPDNAPIVGEAPEIRNYFVAAGLNSVGILTGGGIGKIVAQWIRDGHAPSKVDVTGIHVNRFHRYQCHEEYRSKRVEEALGNTYKVHYPDHQPETCRGAKQSVLHDRLRDANAYFRNVSGWESPAWFAPVGVLPVVEQESFGRENWFPFWRDEHLACRKDVALFDMTFMSKFLVQGVDAGSFLNRLSTANVDGPCGKITYTQWLNEKGFLEADLTVTKLDDDQFMVFATDTMHNQVHSHMMRRLNRNIHAFVTDVTGKYVQINLQGPKSRELLQSLTPHDMTDFPFRRAADIEIGLARVLCTRITYVGELGYELFVPVEQAVQVYTSIMKKAKDYSLRHAGLRALGSLRMEKGYRDYGHDIDNTDTVLEAGLGFTCDFEKPGGFIGKEHVLAQKAAAKNEGGLRKRMAHVLLSDPEPLLHHGEIIWRNGARISDVRSASYGHTVGGAVGLTMLEMPNEPITKDFVRDGLWEVEIAEKRYPCQVSFAPFYDPKGERIKF